MDSRKEEGSIVDRGRIAWRRRVGALVAAWFALVLGIGASPATGLAAPPPDLDAWLASHPAVAGAMIWEFPPVVAGAPRPTPSPAHLPKPTPTATPPPLGLPRPTSTRIAGFPFPIHTPQPTATAAPTPLPSPTPRVLSWSAWPETAKAQLRSDFASYWAWAGAAFPLYDAWAASGFAAKPQGFDAAFSTTIDPDPAPLVDPPVNVQQPKTGGSLRTVLSSTAAFRLYEKNVAMQLVLEIGGHVPWSIAGEPGQALAQLFDGTKFFRWVEKGPSPWGQINATGHVLTDTVIPAPPAIAVSFLAVEGLLQPSRHDTVVAVLDWEREQLRHVISCPNQVGKLGGEIWWGYEGTTAPLSRMINGTVMSDPIYCSGVPTQDPEVRHWTGGCGGTTGFNSALLRTANVPPWSDASAHHKSGFTLDGGERMWLAHSDDPYGVRAAPEIPTSDLLIDEATFQSWFVAESDAQKRLANVSRRSADLFLEYMPAILTGYHCWIDLTMGWDHANSYVYGVFSPAYSLAEVEAFGVWDEIQAQIDAAGGCANVDTPW